MEVYTQCFAIILIQVDVNGIRIGCPTLVLLVFWGVFSRGLVVDDIPRFSAWLNLFRLPFCHQIYNFK